MPEYMKQEQDVHSIKLRIANKRGLDQQRNIPLKSLETISHSFNKKNNKYNGSSLFGSLAKNILPMFI